MAEFKSRLAEARGVPPIRIASDRRSFPLSTTQQRLWFLEQAVPGTLVYQVPAVVHLQAHVDGDALERSVQRLAARHEPLRARFRVAEGSPICEIAEETGFRLDRRSLRGEPPAGRWQAALEAVNDYVRTPFDLEQGPLFRVLLLELDGNEYLLAFVLHHIICEAWSIALLFRELEAVYAEETGGVPARLPELAAQFGDFAVWERDHLDRESVRADVEYWRQQLDGIPALDLPADRPRPATQTQNGAIFGRPLGPEFVGEAEAFAAQRKATPFVVTLAALYALLYRYTGEDTLTVGCPVSSRDRDELQNAIGFFVNTLVFRADLNDDISFDELVERVRDGVLEGFSRQSAPFELIVDELKVERDLSRNPLFQVMFAFQNTPLPALELTAGSRGRVLRPDEVHSATSKVDFSLIVEPAQDGWMAWAEYNTDLFDRWRVEQMLECYERFTRVLMEHADRPISSLPVLSAEERRRIIVDWNATARDVPSDSVVEQFRRQAQASPDRPALRAGNERMSYRELDERSERLARHLAARGIGRATPVAIYLERSFDLVLAELAVLKSGAAYVPVDPAYPAERVAFMIRDCGAALLMTREELDPGLEDVPVLYTDDPVAESAGDESGVEPASESPDDLAYIIYTSGSTGVPKGVEIERRGLRNLVSWHCGAYELDASDVGTLVASPAFDASVWEIWPYLASGACIAIPDDETRVSPEQLVSWMSDVGVTVSFLPTPLAEAVLLQSWPQSSRCRALLTGGDVLHALNSARWPFKLFNHYGPTENSVVTTCAEVDPTENPPSIGRPIDNTEVYVLDRNLCPVPFGAVGELCVSGMGLARGYRNRPELTSRAFVDNPIAESRWPRLYRTGDLCRFQPDGRIRFEGRRDSQVKIRGYRVELGEIESLIGRQAAVRECVVIVRRDAHTQQDVLVAYVVPASDDDSLHVSDLRRALAAQLPQYMIPQFFVELAELPKTRNGKLDRRALPDAAAGPTASSDHVEPETEAERLLARIWTEILGASTVGAGDNFFDLGGNSMLAVRVVHRIREESGLKVNPLVLFSGTLRQTAAAIEEGIPQASTDKTGGSMLRRFAQRVRSLRRLIYAAGDAR